MKMKRLMGVLMACMLLAMALCCPAGRRRQQDPGPGFLKSRDDTKRCGCLPGPWSACQDQDLAADSCPDGLQLHLIISHMRSGPDPLSQTIGGNAQPFFVLQNGSQPSRRAEFRKKEGRQIDRPVRRITVQNIV